MTDASFLALSTRLAAPASDSRPLDRLAGDEQRLAWQREMERAESRTWFNVLKPAEAGFAAAPAALAAGSATAQSNSVPILAEVRAPHAERSAHSAQVSTASPSRPVSAQEGSARQTRSASASVGTSPVARNAVADSTRPSTPWPVSTQASDGSFAKGVQVVAIEMACLPVVAQDLPMPGSIDRQPPIELDVGAPPPSPLATALSYPVASSVRIAEMPAALGAVPGEPVADTHVSPETSPAEHAPVAAALSRSLHEALSPVRLHIEWNGSNARVWIGVDAPVVGQLPALVGDLARWLERAGTRLRSVTCNGAVLFSGDVASHVPAARESHPPACPSVDVILEKEK